MIKPLRIAITTGDTDGVGLEVTAKALAKIRPQRGIQFYIWRAPGTSPKYLRLIDRYFKRITVKDWPSALQLSTDYYKTIVDIESPVPPGKWVELMAYSGMSKTINALVTAPLSKTEIRRSGMRDNGHTDILKRVSKQKNLYMCFLGQEFNVVLLTGHVSIKKAYDQINQPLLTNCIQMTQKMRTHLPARQKLKPIAIVGCNPHAGEEGIIGNKEIEVYQPVLKKLKPRQFNLTQPLVPDVCFQKQYWKKYALYIASYHDQGLIPFKLVHGANSGVQVSLGLPFLRTSVDHGTAKDIYGKDKALSGSMESAIKVAIKRLKNKPITW